MIWKNGLLFKDKIRALMFALYFPEDSFKDQSNTWCEHTLKTVQVHFNNPNKQQVDHGVSVKGFDLVSSIISCHFTCTYFKEENEL